jgi:uncharacterized protein YegL
MDSMWDVTSAAVMPGGGIAKRPLHFILAADASGSMNGAKMQSLNYAISSMLPHLAAWEQAQEAAQVLVRAIRFDNTATWHIEEPTPVADLRWPPLTAQPRARTHMGAALRLMAGALTAERLERRALRPALVLITDGIPTDDYEVALEELLATPGGAAAIRVALAIGPDADHEQLRKFVTDNLPILQADRTDEISDLIMAVTIAVSRMTEMVAERHAMVDSMAIRPPLQRTGDHHADDSIV